MNSGYSVDNLQGEGLGAKLTLLSLLENREEAGTSEPLARNLSMLRSSLTRQHSGYPRTRGEASGWGTLTRDVRIGVGAITARDGPSSCAHSASHGARSGTTFLFYR